MSSALATWALPQISRLLPLDEDSLQQIISYTDTLPKNAAADHLKNLLGDSPQSLEFIASFNSRRQTPPSEARSVAAAQALPTTPGVPKTGGKQPKKKKNIHNLPPRQIQEHGNVAGAYIKRDEDDYMSSSSQQRNRPKQPLANSLALQSKPDAVQLPKTSSGSLANVASNKAPPSTSGPLISDMLAPPSSGSAKSSRTSSPAPVKTKVNIIGGTNMHGAASTLSDLDSAIRSLEIQTNPSLANQSPSPADLAKRKCNCMATRHPLLTIAPNCLSCGKIICVKEGLGPCTFCQASLLSASEIANMVRVLKDERGQARQAANNASHRRAEVSQKPRAFTGRDFLSSAAASASASPLSSAPASEDEGSGRLDKAKEHRDKLLAFQAQNAKRTRIHDEAADFDIPTSGTNMWASPAERAAQLKAQQKVLREMEWNARPEWEKRRVVASIDVVGGKIVRKMAEVERPQSEDEGDGHAEEDFVQPKSSSQGNGGSGAFSQNPLLGALIRPVAKADKGKGKVEERESRSTWRRVQDDNDDNEQWILDGGVYGNRIDGRVLGQEEHAVGS